MAQQMMWDPIVGDYRGQAADGTVVTVVPEAMELANKRAGRTVYDSDWWVETVQSTLEHWGIYSRRWIDAASRVPRVEFSIGEPKSATTQDQAKVDVADSPTANEPGKIAGSGPLTNRIMSGPLKAKDTGKEGRER